MIAFLSARTEGMNRGVTKDCVQKYLATWNYLKNGKKNVRVSERCVYSLVHAPRMPHFTHLYIHI